MRLIYTTDDKKLAYQFSSFLKTKGIENLFEIVTNTDWGSPDYGTYKCYVWIIEEEQLETAQDWLAAFEREPHHPQFNEAQEIHKPKVPPPLKTRKHENRRMGQVTLYILLACAALFLIGEMTAPQVKEPLVNLPATALYSPPIYKHLYYDYPQAYEIIDKLVKVYGIDKLQNPESLPPEGEVLLNKYIQTPIWPGLYDKIVAYFSKTNEGPIFTEPMFEKIRQGEIWRIFTPCLLHANFFHIFFNMIWLVVLGKLIEERLGTSRYCLLILTTAIASNTTQYLMSGANFVGYSGVICGMLAFVWARQKLAPWESYNVAPGVFSFMFFFVMAMLGLQIVSFVLQIYHGTDFFPVVANTAHITGGIVGIVLGRMNSMSIRN